MSLFNLAAGVDPGAPLVCTLLGLDTEEKLSAVPRFRDAYVDLCEEGPYLVLLTRTGGGNREDYTEENDALRQIGEFVDDYDDHFDSTFAHWRYKVPEKHAADVEEYITKGREVGWDFPKPMDRLKSMLKGIGGTND